MRAKAKSSAYSVVIRLMLILLCLELLPSATLVSLANASHSTGRPAKLSGEAKSRSRRDVTTRRTAAGDETNPNDYGDSYSEEDPYNDAVPRYVDQPPDRKPSQQDGQEPRQQQTTESSFPSSNRSAHQGAGEADISSIESFYLHIDKQWKFAEVILIIVISVILNLVTIIGNIMVLISFKMDRSLQTVSNYFLLSLALADLLIGLISMPLYTLYLLLNYWPLGALMCDIWLAIDYLNSNAAVLNMLIISFDRYFSVTRPLTYRAKRTTKHACFMISCAWILSLTIWTPAIFTYPYYKGRTVQGTDKCEIEFVKANTYLTFVTAILAFYIPVIIMIYLYWRIWLETKKRYRDLTTLFLVSGVGAAGPANRANRPPLPVMMPIARAVAGPKATVTNSNVTNQKQNSIPPPAITNQAIELNSAFKKTPLAIDYCDDNQGGRPCDQDKQDLKLQEKCTTDFAILDSSQLRLPKSSEEIESEHEILDCPVGARNIPSSQTFKSAGQIQELTSSSEIALKADGLDNVDLMRLQDTRSNLCDLRMAQVSKTKTESAMKLCKCSCCSRTIRKRVKCKKSHRSNLCDSVGRCNLLSCDCIKCHNLKFDNVGCHECCLAIQSTNEESMGATGNQESDSRDSKTSHEVGARILRQPARGATRLRPEHPHHHDRHHHHHHHHKHAHHHQCHARQCHRPDTRQQMQLGQQYHCHSHNHSHHHHHHNYHHHHGHNHRHHQHHRVHQSESSYQASAEPQALEGARLNGSDGVSKIDRGVGKSKLSMLASGCHALVSTNNKSLSSSLIMHRVHPKSSSTSTPVNQEELQVTYRETASAMNLDPSSQHEMQATMEHISLSWNPLPECDPNKLPTHSSPQQLSSPRPESQSEKDYETRIVSFQNRFRFETDDPNLSSSLVNVVHASSSDAHMRQNAARSLNINHEPSMAPRAKKGPNMTNCRQCLKSLTGSESRSCCHRSCYPKSQKASSCCSRSLIFDDETCHYCNSNQEYKCNENLSNSRPKIQSNESRHQQACCSRLATYRSTSRHRIDDVNKMKAEPREASDRKPDEVGLGKIETDAGGAHKMTRDELKMVPIFSALDRSDVSLDECATSTAPGYQLIETDPDRRQQAPRASGTVGPSIWHSEASAVAVPNLGAKMIQTDDRGLAGGNREEKAGGDIIKSSSMSFKDESQDFVCNAKGGISSSGAKMKRLSQKLTFSDILMERSVSLADESSTATATSSQDGQNHHHHRRHHRRHHHHHYHHYHHLDQAQSRPPKLSRNHSGNSNSNHNNDKQPRGVSTNGMGRKNDNWEHGNIQSCATNLQADSYNGKVGALSGFDQENVQTYGGSQDRHQTNWFKRLLCPPIEPNVSSKTNSKSWDRTTNERQHEAACSTPSDSLGHRHPFSVARHLTGARTGTQTPTPRATTPEQPLSSLRQSFSDLWSSCTAVISYLQSDTRRSASSSNDSTSSQKNASISHEDEKYIEGIQQQSNPNSALRQSSNETTSGTSKPSYSSHHPIQPKSERKAAKTLSTLLLVFIVTWLPYNVLVLIKTLSGGEDQVPEKIWNFSYYLCYINSTINPLCYALCNAQFRRTYMRILKCRLSAEHNSTRRLVPLQSSTTWSKDLRLVPDSQHNQTTGTVPQVSTLAKGRKQRHSRPQR